MVEWMRIHTLECLQDGWGDISPVSSARRPLALDGLQLGPVEEATFSSELKRSPAWRTLTCCEKLKIQLSLRRRVLTSMLYIALRSFSLILEASFTRSSSESSSSSSPPSLALELSFEPSLSYSEPLTSTSTFRSFEYTCDVLTREEFFATCRERILVK